MFRSSITTQHSKNKSHISPTSLIICVQNYSNIYFDDTYLVRFILQACCHNTQLVQRN